MTIQSIPRVSIIVPAFNADRFLRESLDSIVAQSYPNREIIVMDDCSTDRTGEIAQSYGSSVSYFRQHTNRGQFANVNDGIKRARGELIAIYHADDIYDPQIVAKEVDAFDANPEVGAVFALDILIDEFDREYGRLALPTSIQAYVPLHFAKIFNGLLTYKNRFLVCPTSMVAAWVYKAVGGYRGERWQVASDLDMWIRVSGAAPIVILGEHLIRYRHTESQASRSYQRQRTEPELHFAILDEYLAAGNQNLATPYALKAHAAHRAEDQVFIAVRQYIACRLSDAKSTLASTNWMALLRSPEIQRSRVFIIALATLVLARLPWSVWVAAVFYRRWQLAAHLRRGSPLKLRSLVTELRSQPR